MGGGGGAICLKTMDQMTERYLLLLFLYSDNLDLFIRFSGILFADLTPL